MIRYALMIFLFAGVLVVEEMVRTAPLVGVLSPNCGLLFITLYALKARSEQFWIVCFWAGLLKGSIDPAPCGFFIALYLVIVWIVVRIRGLLYLEFHSTQVILLFFAGCLQALACSILVGFGLCPTGGWLDCLRVLGSSATAALLAPIALNVRTNSRFVRILLGS